MTTVLAAATPDDVFNLLLWDVPVCVTILVVVFGMQCYKVWLHWTERRERLLTVALLRETLANLEGKFQTMLDTTVLVKAMAKSFKKDSENALNCVKATVKEGVETATQTAVSLAAASAVPPSGDKIPKPQLPPSPC